jgi:adenine-specific DNA-methyltransferase
VPERNARCGLVNVRSRRLKVRATRVREPECAGEMLLPQKPQFLQHVRALRRLAGNKQFMVERAIGATLARWCAASYPALPAPGMSCTKTFLRAPEVLAFAEFLREESFLAATYWLSTAYAMLLGDECRKNMAMFFTPPSITKGLLNDLAEQGVDFGQASFFDPACGGAAFLTPIALRIREMMRERGFGAAEILAHVEARLFGTDLDPTLCKLSVQFLRMALHEEILESKRVPAFKVHAADSLSELTSMFGKLDVIVCNPPYRKLSTGEIARLAPLYGDVIEGQSNLYSLFISLCVRLLRLGGHAALVTPTSYLSGQNFQRLRTYLFANTDVLHVGMVSERTGVFMDVEQETALMVLRKRQMEMHAGETVKVSVVSPMGEYQSLGECQLPNSGSIWAIPRTTDDADLLIAAARSPFRLSDYGYRVRIGPYVWNRDKRPKFKSFKETERRRIRSVFPLVWSHHIERNGTLQLNGRWRTRDEHYFVDLGEPDHPSVTRRPSVVLQRVTSNDMPRRLVCAPVPSSLLKEYGGFVGENHVVILEQEQAKLALTPKEMAKLLATGTLDRCFRCISGSTNVSAFELSQLPLPDPEELKRLLAEGRDMEDATRLAVLGQES